ncbi:MAG TPA: DUF3179 domain-containing protein [Thermoanaerobaculia bacterium]|nr:DUF3179 domain-containing protein [Thermoanaerobaculia bacterium]
MTLRSPALTGFALAALLGLPAAAAPAAEPERAGLAPAEAYRLVGDLFSERRRVRRAARARLIEAADPTVAPALVDAVFFNTAGRAETVEVLEALLDVRHGSDYHAWLEEIGGREEITPKPGYLRFKAEQFARIDPSFGKFLSPEHRFAIRPEEIVWGGVVKDGIPALRNPKAIPAAAAEYLDDEETVFGVAVGGEAMAYPRRILDWHEMVNDVVGGRAVTLAWCSLCGSGILYDGEIAPGELYTFGTSGLLYRSNKLMYDHQTRSLWSSMTGEPVAGPLTERPEARRPRLTVLPMVVTTWGEWRARHPDTEVLSLDTGHRRDYRPGAAYGAYFASDDLMFPVWKRPDREVLERKDWIWAVEAGGFRKAYPVDALLVRPVVNDIVGGVPIVLVTDPDSEAVRAYDRGRRTLRATDDPDVLADVTSGERFRLTEEALVPVTAGEPEEGEAADEAVHLPRRVGYRAFWFGWYAFFPGTEVWRPQVPPA